jgi:hypothetical protein
MNIRIDHTILKAPQLQTIDLSYRRGENVYEKGAPGNLFTRSSKARYSASRCRPGTEAGGQ